MILNICCQRTRSMDGFDLRTEDGLSCEALMEREGERKDSAVYLLYLLTFNF